jgi:DNA mismatch repair protein MutS
MASGDREPVKLSMRGTGLDSHATSPDLEPERFAGILFDRPQSDVTLEAAEPDCFSDLNLDQVLDAVTAGREEYDLRPFFYTPVRDLEAVRYRHEVLRDLERPDVAGWIATFAEEMRRMRQHLAQEGKLRHPRQKEAWFLGAVEIYCDAVASLTDGLASCGIDSRGLDGFRRYLRGYLASSRFQDLTAERRAVSEALAAVQYTVHLRGNRVTVGTYRDERDYSAQVEETFAKFKEGAPKSYLVRLPDLAAMDHVEEQILDLVARFYPDAFGALREFRARHAGYLDPTIGAFDREVQFYLAYLAHISRLEAAGLPFCYPRVSVRSKEISAVAAFDLALAGRLVPEGREVVCNDFELNGHERILVVTGPNDGGKSTFARMVGQLHHLAGLGLPVPAREARLLLSDRVFAHFEREEDIETLRGKLDDELVRVREILDQATDRSVVIMNESFGSTALQDALFLGTEVINRLIDLDAVGVYVTFVDELSALSPATVSMVATIAPQTSAERTYKLVRQPADGRAYAWAIAEKYGLTYERLQERLES